ncbi:hypothetical protein DRP05_01340 [Archaeoglobales archaeon]|nr:MAG: hypothetical protein DRP05_01340 [Archaeoglobales archaeon]
MRFAKTLLIGWSETGAKLVLNVGVEDITKVILYECSQNTLKKIERLLARKWDLVLLCGRLSEKWIEVVSVIDDILSTTSPQTLSIAFFEVETYEELLKNVHANPIVFDQELIRLTSAKLLAHVMDVFYAFGDNLKEIVGGKIGISFVGNLLPTEERQSIYIPFPINIKSIKDWIINFVGSIDAKDIDKILSRLTTDNSKSNIYWKVTPEIDTTDEIRIVGVAFV